MPQFTPVTITEGYDEADSPIEVLYIPRAIDQNRVATYVVSDSDKVFGRSTISYRAHQKPGAVTAPVRMQIVQPVVFDSQDSDGDVSSAVIRTGRANVEFVFPVTATVAERKRLVQTLLSSITEFRDAIEKQEPIWA